MLTNAQDTEGPGIDPLLLPGGDRRWRGGVGGAYLAPCPQRRTRSAALWGRCCPGGTGRRSGRAGAGRKMSRVQTPGPQSLAGSEGPGGLCSNKPVVQAQHV